MRIDDTRQSLRHAVCSQTSVAGSDDTGRDGVARLKWLLKVGRALTSELDLPTVLDQILEQPSMEIATAVGSDTDLPRIL